MRKIDFELSEKQRDILDSLVNWDKDGKKMYITLGGYAGTGKTTLLGYYSNLLREIDGKRRIAFCSYTGKASRVLQQRLNDTKSIMGNDYVGTIHRLIYKAVTDSNDNIIGWEKIDVEQFKYDMIVVDEASMVTQDIWRDLLSFGVPVLAVGDHGQLPPIEGSFNLMESPELRLEEIYRQEKDNPIIAVSEIARKYGSIPFREFSKTVKKINKKDEDSNDFVTSILEEYDNDLMVLCGYNSTRNKLNIGVRQLLEFESSSPSVSDRVICLKNNHEKEIYNGMTGSIVSIFKNVDNKDNPFYEADIYFDGEDSIYSGSISINQFNNPNTLPSVNGLDYFDFGYCMTVHKAQGSQSPRVLIFEERFPRMTDDMWRRWLYTGVTRAMNELYIVG